MKGYAVLLLLALLLILPGCAGLSPAPGDDSRAAAPALLTAEKRDAIGALAEEGTDFYTLTAMEEKTCAIEIQLSLRFLPLTHQEVMALTDPLAAGVATLFDNEVPVYVAATLTLEGFGEDRVFGESIFTPGSEHIAYRLYGRDYVMGYGDP